MSRLRRRASFGARSSTPTQFDTTPVGKPQRSSPKPRRKRRQRGPRRLRIAWADSGRKHRHGSREGSGARRTAGTGCSSNARLHRPLAGRGSSATEGVLRTAGRAARCGGPPVSTAWVAGNVRAKAMLDRRIGPARARELAVTGSLAQAEQILADSPYRHGVQVGQTLAEAEHALAATVLWHLRVLAGWQPRAGAIALRLLAGWFEIANICGHARTLSGGENEASFRWVCSGAPGPGCIPRRRLPN